MKIQTPRTPDDVFKWWEERGECMYCRQLINHEIHLQRHYVKWHAYLPQRYWKLYIWPQATCQMAKLDKYDLYYIVGGWRFVRNFKNAHELQKARRTFQKRNIPTAIVFCTKE